MTRTKRNPFLAPDAPAESDAEVDARIARRQSANAIPGPTDEDMEEAYAINDDMS